MPSKLLVASLVAGVSAQSGGMCNYPGGNCYELRAQECKQGSTAGVMTLHGLWPQWTSGCQGTPFDATLLAPIRTEMEAKWLSCPEDDGNNEKFWQHEWEKHGTCSGMDQLSFFKETLSLFDAHASECKSGSECSICFDKGLENEMTCSDGVLQKPVEKKPTVIKTEAMCTYPGGECYELRAQECKQGSTVGVMTLHGLWPQWTSGCQGPAFDISLLDPIKSEMDAKWLSCPEDDGNNEKFWQHEWEKHGTCTGMDQLSFFTKALSLLDAHGSECNSGSSDCSICFDKGLDSEMTCSDGLLQKPVEKKVEKKLAKTEAMCNYPGGECYELRAQECKQGSTAGTMTLHGLWPQWTSGCQGAAFDITLLASIQSEMEAKWLSCPEDDGNNEKFWQHEWEKHGTCSGMDQLSFFTKTLALFDAHGSECQSGSQCSICFDKAFDSEMTCSDGTQTIQV